MRRVYRVCKASTCAGKTQKGKEEESKKTIGTIIGDGYNCSKEIMSSNKEGINLYSMVSIAYKAIQEQQDEIKKLQAKDKEKDNIIQSLIKRIETLEKGGNK